MGHDSPGPPFESVDKPPFESVAPGEAFPPAGGTSSKEPDEASVGTCEAEAALGLSHEAQDILDEEASALECSEEPLQATKGKPAIRDKQVNISFSEEEAAKIDRAAAFFGISRAKLVRRCVLDSSLIGYASERIAALKSA